MMTANNKSWITGVLAKKPKEFQGWQFIKKIVKGSVDMIWSKSAFEK